MKTREQELEQAHRLLVAAVSHDLRTPLTSPRAMIEAINDGVVTDEASVRRYLTLAQQEIQNLSNLVDDLFELTQLDAGAPNWTKESGSLRDLISDTLETLRVQAERQGVHLTGFVEPSIDPVIDELVQNSARAIQPCSKRDSTYTCRRTGVGSRATVRRRQASSS